MKQLMMTSATVIIGHNALEPSVLAKQLQFASPHGEWQVIGECRLGFTTGHVSLLA